MQRWTRTDQRTKLIRHGFWVRFLTSHLAHIVSIDTKTVRAVPNNDEEKQRVRRFKFITPTTNRTILCGTQHSTHNIKIVSEAKEVFEFIENIILKNC